MKRQHAAPKPGSLLTRRAFVQGAGAVGLGLLAGCGPLPWQNPTPARSMDRVARIGFLSPGSQGRTSPQVAAFEAGLREAGYTVGQDLHIYYRFANGATDQLPSLGTELVGLNPEVIVTMTTQATLAVVQATRTIPIVFTDVGDPVGVGLVASLARPGGNVTGPTGLGTQLHAKRLALLKEVVPSIACVAVLWSPVNPANERAWRDTQAAADALAVQIRSVEVRAATDFEPLLAAAVRGGADALFPLTGPPIGGQQQRIVGLAAEHSLPAIYWGREFTDVGGLMAYAPEPRARYGRAAYYVDRILKGAKPADLPVEQPTTFEFVINLQTAQALSLTIPQHVLLQATEVIQ